MENEFDQDALAEEWAAALEESGDEDAAEDAKAMMSEGDSAGGDAGGDADSGDDEALAAEWAAALANEEEVSIQKEKQQAGLASQTTDAAFADLTDEAKAPRPDGTKRDLDFILDIPLDVSAELGRTKLLINELLQLGQGSVIELNKLAGEPLEIYVNGKLVARGEAVVINEKFGVRLTDIISPIERVKQLA